MSITYNIKYPGKLRNELLRLLCAVAFGIALGHLMTSTFQERPEMPKIVEAR